MNVCTDQLLLLLVDKTRIASLSYFATDAGYSSLAMEAAGIPLNRGQADEVMALHPDLVLTSAFSATFAANALQRLSQRVERLGFATTREEVVQILRTAAAGELKGVLAVNDLPLVSIDFNHDPHSSIFEASETKVIDGTLVKVMSWYDNEWGFSNRMLDTARALMNAKG